jgi:hypothetical protein
VIIHISDQSRSAAGVSVLTYPGTLTAKAAAVDPTLFTGHPTTPTDPRDTAAPTSYWTPPTAKTLPADPVTLVQQSPRPGLLVVASGAPADPPTFAATATSQPQSPNAGLLGILPLVPSLSSGGSAHPVPILASAWTSFWQPTLVLCLGVVLLLAAVYVVASFLIFIVNSYHNLIFSNTYLDMCNS